MSAGQPGAPGRLRGLTVSLAGIVEVEEGEVNGQELCIASHSIARTSFAKEPHVEQVSPGGTARHPCLCTPSWRPGCLRSPASFSRSHRP